MRETYRCYVFSTELVFFKRTKFKSEFNFNFYRESYVEVEQYLFGRFSTEQNGCWFLIILSIIIFRKIFFHCKTSYLRFYANTFFFYISIFKILNTFLITVDNIQVIAPIRRIITYLS